MLSREQAEKRLKEFHVAHWKKTRVEELGKLPIALKTTGRALLEVDADGKAFRNWEKGYKARHQATEDLGKMKQADRRRLFAVLFPRLADAIEAGWQLFARLPYETGSGRKAFRAPGNDEAKESVRVEWFQSLLDTLEGYDPDALWVATWAAYVNNGYGADELGILLAAAVDAGGELGPQIQTILEESASGQHEIGGMGRHVTRALLTCSNPAAWEFVEKLLMAAQRQEGLRQVILEAVDEAHPGAFRKMLRLILDKNLLRFAATVRAVDVWFGLRWDALTPAVLKRTVEQAVQMLEEPVARAEVLKTDKTEKLHLALWAVALEDANAAIAPASALLDDPSVERRFIGANFLVELDLPAARAALLRCLEDVDLRIAAKALEELPDPKDGPDLWDRLVALLGRMPAKRKEGEALVWPWATTDIDRQDVAGALADRLGKRPPTALLPFIHDLSGYERGNLIDRLAKLKAWNAETRDLMFSLVGDRDSWVREKALKALKKCSVTAEDAQRMEAVLTRKGGDLRRAVLTLLVKQTPTLALASADRLLASKKAPQRVAGLELLRVMVEKKRLPGECRQRAAAYQQKHPALTEEEQLQVDIICDIQRVKPSLADSFGLADPATRSKPVEPVARKVTLCSPAAVALLQDLDRLIREHKDTPVTIDVYGEPTEQLLGNVHWQFPSPHRNQPLERDIARLPLREVWEAWYAKRPRRLIDRDGLELLRARVWLSLDKAELKGYRKRFGKDWAGWLGLLTGGHEPTKLRYGQIVGELIDWLVRLHPPAGAMDFLLDVVETGFAHVPDEARKRVVDVRHWQKRDRDWRFGSPLADWVRVFERHRRENAAEETPAHRVRLWQLMHWRDQPAPGVARMRPELDLLLAGARAGQTTEADLYDQVLGPDDDDFDTLRELTAPGRLDTADCPPIVPVVGRCVERVLEIELSRGEMPTPATGAAQHISALHGLPTLLRVLRPLGKKPLARQTYGESKAIVLTHLVKVTRPRPEDTPEAFAEQTKKAGLDRERLLQLAFAAPQWLDHVEHTLGWPGLKEAVWWFLAHMPDGHSGLDPTVDVDDFDDFDDDLDVEEAAPAQPLDPWERVIRERTPLSREDRRGGAVDAGWFHRAYEPIGRKRWDAIAAAARYGGNGFKKAIRLADVLLGRVKRADLVHEIRERKFKESVRLFGLLPLPVGPKREAELLARYKIQVEYRRYARALSPMSREDAERTARIGLENLARTAGYADPIRLEWAMEARAISDLAAGPVAVTADGVTVTLSIDADAQLQMEVRRGDRVLKAVPPLVRKNPRMAQHLERRADIRRQGSRVKQSLEAMMVKGDTLAGRELKQLFIHPLIRPLLERLVLVGEGARGYATADGLALVDHAGRRSAVRPDEVLRIAHPHDLFAAGDWAEWQADCFRSERVQPFKQVFRELYVVTRQEEADGAASSRYASQQVNPSQANALWGNRGWNTREGVEKTFYQEGIIASVDFRHHGWTAAEVSGRTLDTIKFVRRGDYRPIPLAEVPPRVFSEAMRDCDLVVSVAHVGGVDPEASASTTQMRESLVRETCAVLRIDNYEIKGTHVLIDGKLGRYSLHLGSGVVHRMPGGSLCIVPVQAQQRGRLFLPFADDDPRTAEVVSKMLLLARDHEIQDPSILEQLR